jgi:trans-2,3-dihydro-3-hydroxyanthranilate isomerase
VPRRFPFVQVDVFTDRVFGGNPLAVFLEPDGLSDAEMQSIALEMNLSETTFVFAPTRADCVARVRIFTPTAELPFAGHPTVGTTWVLATRGLLPKGARAIALEERIGPVAVRIEGDPESPSMIWMAQRDAEFDGARGESQLNGAAIAAALGLAEADLLPGAPVCVGSTGLPFLFVPLKTPETVDRAVLNPQTMAAAYRGQRQGVFLFAPDRAAGPGRVYSRMLAGDTLGIPEDPATGSASGPLGVYVAERGLVELPEPPRIVSLQGNQMGRPSFVHIALERRDGRYTGIEVGGSVAPVLEGVLTLP